MLSRSLLCMALAAASTTAFADTVWLKNGDRLTGTIRVFDGGKLVLANRLDAAGKTCGLVAELRLPISA